METNMITSSIIRATIGAIAMTVSTVAFASSSANFEKVDLVKEGIDLKKAIVLANSNGYGGYQKDEHVFAVRLFAKGKGAKNVFAAGIGNKPGMSHIEVTPGDWMFRQVTPNGDDGWGVYKKSLQFNAKLSKIEWYKSPVQACKDNMAKLLSQGKSKGWILGREWNVEANALVRFYAAAAPKNSIKKREFFDGGQTLQDNIGYPVLVKCSEKL
jgi:hypothetical protein